MYCGDENLLAICCFLCVFFPHQLKGHHIPKHNKKRDTNIFLFKEFKEFELA